ncbi:MAG: hypothetical protein GC151_07210 [Betaproteobacteria bacterium]|nr:hypothetical protein [Betaproteobacteria bacterium]
MKSFLAKAAFAVAATGLAGAVARATGDTYRVGADDRVTVGDYAWAVGRVCYDIEKDDGSPGTVKMWTPGLSELDERVYRGSACFPVVGFARIRAGYAPDGPVTIRVAHDSVTGLPFVGRVR